jgi:hypothetical protein
MIEIEMTRMDKDIISFVEISLNDVENIEQYLLHRQRRRKIFYYINKKINFFIDYYYYQK